jgi:hypothetical protein
MALQTKQSLENWNAQETKVVQSAQKWARLHMSAQCTNFCKCWPSAQISAPIGQLCTDFCTKLACYAQIFTQVGKISEQAGQAMTARQSAIEPV